MIPMSSTAVILPGLLALSILGAGFASPSQGSKIEQSDERSIYELGKWKKQAISSSLCFAVYPMRAFEKGKWNYYLHLLMDTSHGGSIELDPDQARQLVKSLWTLERIRPEGMRSENLEVNLYGVSFAFAKQDAPGMNPGVRIIVGESASQGLPRDSLKLLRDLLPEGIQELASVREVAPTFLV